MVPNTLNKRVFGPIGVISVCTFCGKEFSQKHFEHTRTCSPKCTKNQRGLSCRRRIKRICATCSKEFEITPKIAKKGTGIYCSRECRWKNKFIYSQKQKVLAESHFYMALNKGKVIKKPCEICGNPESEAHHYKGYAEEHIFDVIWLCPLHHVQEHERLRRTGQVSLL